MMAENIRVARVDDAEQILAIYRPIVEETTISFELETPSVAEMQERIEKTLLKFPWLVADDAGQVLGYAYANAHRERLAYQWSADVSVYMSADARRRGIARRLYTELLKILRSLGYYNAYAGIAQPNEGSVKLHGALGFTQVAVYPQVGYKLGAWRDVGWWGMVLQPHVPAPTSPRLFSDWRTDR